MTNPTHLIEFLTKHRPDYQGIRNKFFQPVPNKGWYDEFGKQGVWSKYSFSPMSPHASVMEPDYHFGRTLTIILTVIEYKNNIKNGTHKTFWDNGAPRSELVFINGEMKPGSYYMLNKRGEKIKQFIATPDLVSKGVVNGFWENIT
jgi:hypothetical protein